MNETSAPEEVLRRGGSSKLVVHFIILLMVRAGRGGRGGRGRGRGGRPRAPVDPDAPVEYDPKAVCLH